MAQFSYRVALLAYFSLIVLMTLWTLVFLPDTFTARGGLWLIQVIPLCLPLYGLLRRSTRAFLLASLLVLLYFAYAVTVVMQTPPGEAIYAVAWSVILCATAFFSFSMAYLRITARA